MFLAFPLPELPGEATTEIVPGWAVNIPLLQQL
jgi:hypothetical protein